MIIGLNRANTLGPESVSCVKDSVIFVNKEKMLFLNIFDKSEEIQKGK